MAAFADGVLYFNRAREKIAHASAVPTLWSRGTTRLLDYGRQGDDQGPVLLLVPSLVNRCRILDLTPATSLVRSLAGRGFRPLLIDWGELGEEERTFSLTDYIAGRLEPALEAAVAASGGRPVGVIGYCMGGLLALALTERRPGRVAALALLATPWDFSAYDPGRLRILAAMNGWIDELTRHIGMLPVDVLQAMFASIDPLGAVRKFAAFGSLDKRRRKARLFVALEDWLNDGVPLAGPVARECLIGWYGENSPAQGKWEVAGRAVDPGRIACPSLVLVPGRDRIVPPLSALPLGRLLPGAETHVLDAGHIGMVAGGRGKELLHDPLAAWLAAALN